MSLHNEHIINYEPSRAELVENELDQMRKDPVYLAAVIDGYESDLVATIVRLINSDDKADYLEELARKAV